MSWLRNLIKPCCECHNCNKDQCCICLHVPARLRRCQRPISLGRSNIRWWVLSKSRQLFISHARVTMLGVLIWRVFWGGGIWFLRILRLVMPRWRGWHPSILSLYCSGTLPFLLAFTSFHDFTWYSPRCSLTKRCSQHPGLAWVDCQLSEATKQSLFLIVSKPDHHRQSAQ